MNSHERITALNAKGGGVYDLKRGDGEVLRVFICECYAYGVAEYKDTVDNLGKINAVIINSAWCGYSPDAKFHCREQHVGLFKISEFMAALHRNDYWNYLTKDEKEYFEKQGWI